MAETVVVMTELLLLAWILVSVADGDTITVRDRSERRPARPAEVVAPERTQSHTQTSTKNLNSLCRDKVIGIQTVDVDRYGRTVADVTCDCIDVNWRQVEDGLAWCFTRYPKQPDTCLPLERAARDAERGLWREANP